MSVIARVVPRSMESCALGGESARVLGVDATWSQSLKCSISELPVNADQILIVWTPITPL